MIILPLIHSFKFNFTLFYGGNPKRRKNTLGNVKFTEKNICINHRRNTIHYDVYKLEYLEINGGLFWDYNPIDYAFGGDGITKRRHSGKTKFVLKFSDKSISVHFQITSKDEFKELTRVLTSWYNSKKFQIREYHLGKERMLLLDPYRTYEQIQDVKKEIGIQSMYN